MRPSEAVMLTEPGIFFNQMDENVETTFLLSDLYNQCGQKNRETVTLPKSKDVYNAGTFPRDWEPLEEHFHQRANHLN